MLRLCSTVIVHHLKFLLLFSLKKSNYPTTLLIFFPYISPLPLPPGSCASFEKKKKNNKFKQYFKAFLLLLRKKFKKLKLVNTPQILKNYFRKLYVFSKKNSKPLKLVYIPYN